jgi:hypothetical protein
MAITAIWQAQAWPGLEHMVVRFDADGIVADGMVIALDSRPIRLHYRIRCDAGWAVRRLDIDETDGDTDLTFLADGRGHWTDGDGRAVGELAGCIDVDIAATPFTNTLPIRRLNLHPGEARDLRMLYVLVRELTISAADQRYTCLEQGDGGGLYRYESGSFRADLPVDANGLVVDYPGFWRRLWP